VVWGKEWAEMTALWLIVFSRPFMVEAFDARVLLEAHAQTASPTSKRQRTAKVLFVLQNRL
jgi:hypothetical protein